MCGMFYLLGICKKRFQYKGNQIKCGKFRTKEMKDSVLIIRKRNVSTDAIEKAEPKVRYDRNEINKAKV